MQENNKNEITITTSDEGMKINADAPVESNLLENRKTRRFKAKLVRSNPVARAPRQNWVKRIIGEMSENTSVVDKVVDGKLDRFLK